MNKLKITKSLTIISILVVFLSPCFALQQTQPQPQPQPPTFKGTFSQFVQAIKHEALQKGFSKQSVDNAFKDVHQLKRVIHKEHHQPELTRSFKRYHKALVSPRRVRHGQERFKSHVDLLKLISQKYHVDPEYIVALWGLESDYGESVGHFSEFSALTTLAYNKHRRKFFKKELFAALTMIDKKGVPMESMHGSWAGAMGQCQFMPRSFLAYAVNYDKVGYADIWHSVPDVLASIANYLHGEGWQEGYHLLYRVELTKAIDSQFIGLKYMQSIQAWRKQGVMIADSKNFNKQKGEYSLLLPDEDKRVGYLVNHRNFTVIRRWNASTHYAITVGILANKINI